jgi:hypothetical protein
VLLCEGIDGSSQHGSREENKSQKSHSVTQDHSRPVVQQEPIARTTVAVPVDHPPLPVAAAVVKVGGLFFFLFSFDSQTPATTTIAPTSTVTTSHNLSSWLSSANVLKNNIASKLQELREEVSQVIWCFILTPSPSPTAAVAAAP